MRHSYSKILGSIRLAVLDLSPAEGMEGTVVGGLVINRVNTPHDFRGRGHARELMRECLADADAEGITLHLWINAYGDMSTKQLASWYERCGFVGKEGFYTRIPNKG
jgi:GNAT superfamily N-acetyltransferase